MSVISMYKMFYTICGFNLNNLFLSLKEAENLNTKMCIEVIIVFK